KVGPVALPEVDDLSGSLDALVEERQVLVPNALPFQRPDARARDLIWSPEVDDRPKLQGVHKDADILRGQFLQAVGPEDPSEPGLPAVDRRMPAEVAEVEGADEHELSRCQPGTSSGTHFDAEVAAEDVFVGQLGRIPGKCDGASGQDVGVVGD